MKTRPFSSLVLVVLLLRLALCSSGAAEQSKNGDAKLRESLRSTMMRLRDAENARAVLESAKAEADLKNKELTGQVATLTKQLAADKDAADKTISELTGKLAGQEAQVAKFKEALEKWEASHKQIVEVARNKEAERAKLSDQVIVVERRVADQQTKNAAMFKLANEILHRYEKFGLGEAITAREPFTGITRVKLQGMVQDYQDKLVDQKIRP